MTDAYVLDAVRTPFGKFGGSIAGVRPDDLAAHIVRESVARASDFDPSDIDPARVNAWGGAVALGHPLGASGARVLGTLARRLQVEGGRYGVAAICIGVGQGLAVVLENVSSTSPATNKEST